MRRFVKTPLFWLILSAGSLVLLLFFGENSFALAFAGFTTGLWFETCMRDGWLT